MERQTRVNITLSKSPQHETERRCWRETKQSLRPELPWQPESDFPRRAESKDRPAKISTMWCQHRAIANEAVLRDITSSTVPSWWAPGQPYVLSADDFQRELHDAAAPVMDGEVRLNGVPTISSVGRPWWKPASNGFTSRC